MKKALWWVVGLMPFVCLVAGLVLFIVVQHRTQSIAAQKLPSLEDLDHLVAPLKQERNGQAPKEEAESDMAEASPVPTLQRPSSLPWRLERTPSAEALAAQFGGGRCGPLDTGTGILYEYPNFTKTVETLSLGFGSENTANKWEWRTGLSLLKNGEYEEARQRLYKGFEANPWAGWCAFLAWLEPDPEKASRLLEMSILPLTQSPVDNVTRSGLSNVLANAVELARATESKPLADHYLERLREVDPERALQYEAAEKTGAEANY